MQKPQKPIKPEKAVIRRHRKYLSQRGEQNSLANIIEEAPNNIPFPQIRVCCDVDVDGKAVLYLTWKALETDLEFEDRLDIYDRELEIYERKLEAYQNWLVENKESLKAKEEERIKIFQREIEEAEQRIQALSENC